ncbi:MAG: hypothetical protein KBT02_13540 [Treponema sp.]|nr:hypothetical protein [Candidatus Treponema caballi]
MNKTKTVLFILVSAFFTLFFFSCEKKSVSNNLTSETLFSLKYGNFENELKFYDLSGGSEISSRIVMRNGFFYISDSTAKKVMEVNSYGDLMLIMYNEETNPVPTFIKMSDITPEETGVPSANATQRATIYPFNRISNIAVDTAKYMYITDYLPEDRYEENESGTQVLRQVILRFDENGRFIDYIGQQGPGGSPFPYVKELYTTKNNELVVVTITATGYEVFWFNNDGFLKYMVPVSFDTLPVPKSDANREIFKSLEAIVPDYSEQKLYLKIDYSVMEYDESSKVQSGISYDKTLLYPLNLTTETYEEPILIPAFDEVLSNEYSKITYKVPYDLLGITESGWVFFIIADETGYSVMIVQPDTQKIVRRHLDIPDDYLVYYSMSLSDDGIISLMLSTDSETKVMWWRTDQLIKSL